jgi:hypothetical protein
MARSLFTLAVLLLACAALAAPAPKPFASGWGGPVDLDRDCKIRRGEDSLIIEMPGSDHDYDPRRGKFNAPRLFYEREIDGEFLMQIRVRIDCRPSMQSTVERQPSYVAAGFLVIPPDNPSSSLICSRLALGAVRAGNDVEGYIDLRDWLHVGTEFRRKHPDVKIFERRVSKESAKGWKGYAYLQLDRQRSRLGFSASSDGKDWKLSSGMAIGSREKLKVCLAAYSTSSEPSKVRFDQLKITRGKKKEPSKEPSKEPLGGPSIYKAGLSLPSFPLKTEMPATDKN